MKQKITFFLMIGSLLFGILAFPSQVLAQEGNQNISITTNYPSQLAELGESTNINLKVNVGDTSQTVNLAMGEIPAGWEATFRGGGRVIKSIFVEANSSGSVDLRLEPPEQAKSGIFNFVVLAESVMGEAQLLITLTVQEKVPASLSFDADLPTIKGSPTTTFRYTTTLKNEGDQEVLINLTADAPSGFLPKFKLSGQEVTSFPMDPNQSKTINVELNPLVEIPAGSYPFTIYANGGDLQASLKLTAEVTGQHKLAVSGLDGRLSGKANAGKETTLQILLRNTGTAPAQGIELSSNEPSGWSVTFDPEVIAEIPAGEQTEVKATIKPAEKAVAGDYMITINARPADGVTESVDFRITVITSTLWGVVGIGLIAVAVGVVALAVMRFGRR